MGVVGFDIGNENCAIAVAKNGGIDVLLNDESKRETPAVVSFGEKQRFLGSAGAAFAATNPKSTISQIKRLIGRQYKEPSVEEDLKLLPFETSEGPRGGVLIHLEYLGKTWTFMPVEILGMLFSHLKQMTEKNLGSPIVDCVIGIPSYFTDLQRREYLDAASIAGLRPLKLMHDCTAVALGYGMYKTDFSNKGPTNVMFVDIGHSDTQVTLAAFEKGKMTILSHSFDQHLGGRDFDEVLFRHFASQFKEQYDIDVYENVRASIKLRASCEKLKKVLSANEEATLNIDGLIDDKDLNGFITREDFENLSLELLNRVTLPCCNVVNDSGLFLNGIHTIELVGSGSRIPVIVQTLKLLFGKEPMRTLNGSECVARGCALDCAMLSPTVRVPDYKVQDYFPYSIGTCLIGGKNKTQPGITLFPKGSPFPSDVTGSPFPSDMAHRYQRNSTFPFQVLYTNKTEFPVGISHNIGHFNIGPFQTSGAENVKAIVTLKLNIHGIVEIESASAEEPGWIRNSNLNLPFSANLDVAITKNELREAQKKEKMLAEQDIEVEKTKEKRNTLESFIYTTRTKLLSIYWGVATELEHETIFENLQKTEDWLYQEGHDESEQVYIEKHQDLKKLSDPVENRYKDENARIEAEKALRTYIDKNRSDAEFLPPSQKNEVINECNEAEHWLTPVSQIQDSLAKNGSPTYCTSAITGITQNFVRRCEDIKRSKTGYSESVVNERTIPTHAYKSVTKFV